MTQTLGLSSPSGLFITALDSFKSETTFFRTLADLEARSSLAVSFTSGCHFTQNRDGSHGSAEETGDGPGMLQPKGQEQVPSRSFCPVPRLSTVSPKPSGLPISPTMATVSRACQLNTR